MACITRICGYKYRNWSLLVVLLLVACTFPRPALAFSFGNKQTSKIYSTTTTLQATRQRNPRANLPLDISKNEATSPHHQEDPNHLNCEHFGECPGCVVEKNFDSVDVVQSAQLYFSSSSVWNKRADVVRGGRHDNMEEDNFFKVILPSAPTGWRSQAKLVAAPKTSTWSRDGCILGLYKRGTHSVLPIPSCQVHDPILNQAVQTVQAATSKVRTPAFTLSSREGGLRYVQFQVERSTGKVCLTLVWAASMLKQAQPGISRLVKELKKADNNNDLWHSIWCHCNDGPGNNIFSKKPNTWYRLHGPEFLREPIPTSPDNGHLFFTPNTFRQGNLDGFDAIVQHVARTVPAGSAVCELYAGVGVLGLSTFAHHEQQKQQDEEGGLVWLRCSDENPANTQCFYKSLKSMGVESNYDPRRPNRDEDDYDMGPAQRVSYAPYSARTAMEEGQALGANVVIVDPPRKGLDPAVLEELCKPQRANQPFVESPLFLDMDDEQANMCNDVEMLIYVSCGFDSLAYDLDRLLSSQGGWLLEEATGYLLFPGSNHIETVCVLTRNPIER